MFNNTFYKMSILEKIKTTLSDPKEVALIATGLGFFAFYAFYARNKIFDLQVPQPKQNSLELSLNGLIDAQAKPNVIKIAIVQSSPASYDFKRMVVTKLKQFLISLQLNTLVNCAPLKLFQAGASIFTQTLSTEDPEDEQQYLSYFQNALKCQLTIQRTIIDIDQIKKKQNKTYLICDTNSLDLKVQHDRRLWNKFIEKQKISEDNLKNNYNYVFHLQSPDADIPADLLDKCFKEMADYDRNIDNKISQAWQGFNKYFLIRYRSYLMMEENVEYAIQEIVERIRMDLPRGTFYERKRVFIKQW